MPEPQSLVRIPGRGVAAQEKLQLLCERENGQPSAPEVRAAHQKHTARHTPRHNAGTKVGVGHSRSKLVVGADEQARCGAPKGVAHEACVRVVATNVWNYTNGVLRLPPRTRTSSTNARFSNLHQLRHSLAG